MDYLRKRFRVEMPINETYRNNYDQIDWGGGGKKPEPKKKRKSIWCAKRCGRKRAEDFPDCPYCDLCCPGCDV